MALCSGSHRYHMNRNKISIEMTTPLHFSNSNSKHINLFEFIFLLIFFSPFFLQAQESTNSTFWVGVDSKIINPVKGTPKSFSEIRSEGTLLVNNSGAMLLLYGNRGMPANPVPMYSYVSNDGGVTWEYQTPFTTYNGYEISTYDLSVSGKYFTTGSFNIGTDGKPVYFFSTDGKNWSAVNKSDLLDKGYYGTGFRSIIEAKNGKLSEYLNLKSAGLFDVDEAYKLHKIYYPDGSIKTANLIETDKTGRDMANYYPYQPSSGAYVRGNVLIDYRVIREAYFTCEGKYFANADGFSYISDDDISYKIFSSGLFESTLSMKEKYFPIACALFGLGVTSSNEVKLYAKIKNGNWEDTQLYSSMNSYPGEPRIKYNPKTKRFYIFKNFQYGITKNNENAVLLQSKKTYECDCMGNVPAPEENKVRYGTTVITHGWQLPAGNNPTSEGEWVNNMAKAILSKVKGNGCIYRYQKESGIFLPLDNDKCKEGEKILMFDWASESNSISAGYSEAAGDALFNALLWGEKQGKFGLKNIHFIGHSRGTVVNTEVVERLLYLKNNYTKYMDIVSVDQVTNLDPHDWGGGGNLGLHVADDWDNHPKIVDITFPPKRVPNNGVIAWEGVVFSDSYYQENPLMDYGEPKNGDLPGKPAKFRNPLDGRPVECTYNVDWTAITKNHSDIHDYYISTIKSDNINSSLGGYQYSRICGNLRPPINPDQCSKKDQKSHFPEFDFYSNMQYIDKSITNQVKKSRIRGIMNGSFDRSNSRIFPDLQEPADISSKSKGSFGLEVPGWEQHGGGFKGDMSYRKPVTDNHGNNTEIKPTFEIEEGVLKMYQYKNSTIPTSITHNRFYVPLDADKISFKYKTTNLKTGVLNLLVKDITTQMSTKPIQQILTSNTIEFKEYFLDITPYQDHIITLEFNFTGIALSGDQCNISIDDVKLLPKISSAKSQPAMTNNTVEKVYVSQSNTSPSPITSAPNGIQNGNFNSSQGWISSGGTVLFNNGEAALRPKENKLAVKIRSTKFKASDDSKKITLKIDKQAVSSGDFKIMVIDGATGIPQTVYSDQIRETGNKVNNGINKVNKFLNTGELPTSEKTKTFEEVSADISKFAGKEIFIEISYENFGLNKPQILIDDIELKN